MNDIMLHIVKLLAQLSARQLETVAYQFAKADAGKAEQLDDALACALGDVPAVHVWLAQAIGGLDEQQECDLATTLVAADERRADAFRVTLGMALEAAMMTAATQTAPEGAEAPDSPSYPL